ncbi:MAG: LysR family transcriptional regulator [Rhizobiales bacterium]|nr:LysR family transcriptional regulator [Hyphomicrobiales bacterium]
MQPNLVDQLEVFLAIAETGSFSAAAKRLGRAVSAVTYGLGNLESHYQITLFDRSGYRPRLTEEGHALLQDAEIIFRRIDRLNARISALRNNADVEIRIAVDAGFDHALLGAAVADLMAEFPHVNLRLKTVHEASAMTELQAGKVQIALLPLQAGLPGKGIDGRDIALAQHRIVAAPGHPLAKLPDGFPLSALDDHRQIIVADPEIDMRRLDYRVHITDVMIVDSYEMQIELIRRGIVWGFALTHHVRADVAAGRLRELHCAAVEQPGTLRFGAVWLVKTPPGPAATRLLDLISHHSTHPAPAY